MSSKPIYSHQVITNGAMSGSINSTVTIISQLSLINYQLTWSGTSPVGDAKIQVSNDYAINSDGSVRNAGTWSDYSSVDASATQAVSGNTGSLMFNLQSVAAYAIRIRYARTSGTGTLQAFLNAKSFGLGTVPQTFGALGLSALTLLANGNTSLFANALLTLTGSIVDVVIDSELNIKNTGTASNIALWDIGNTDAVRISAPDDITAGYQLTLPAASATVNGQTLVVTSRSAGQITLDWGSGGGGGSPGGANTAVQFNDSSAFGGDEANFAWDNTNKALVIGGTAPYTDTAAKLVVIGTASSGFIDIVTTTPSAGGFQFGENAGAGFIRGLRSDLGANAPLSIQDASAFDLTLGNAACNVVIAGATLAATNINSGTAALAIGGNTITLNNSAQIGRPGATGQDNWITFDDGGTNAIVCTTTGEPNGKGDGTLEVLARVFTISPDGNGVAASLQIVTGDGSNFFVAQSAPASLAASYTVIWPDLPGTAGQSLKIASVAGSVLTLEWA